MEWPQPTLTPLRSGDRQAVPVPQPPSPPRRSRPGGRGRDASLRVVSGASRARRGHAPRPGLPSFDVACDRVAARPEDDRGVAVARTAPITARLRDWGRGQEPGRGAGGGVRSPGWGMGAGPGARAEGWGRGQEPGLGAGGGASGRREPRGAGATPADWEDGSVLCVCCHRGSQQWWRTLIHNVINKRIYRPGGVRDLARAYQGGCREISQSEKPKYHMISLLCGL